MYKYRRNIPYLGEEEKKAVADVIDSGMVARGKITAEFEKKFAEFMNKKFAVALSSCTAGLQLALEVIEKDLSALDVIIPDFTFVATGNAVRNRGWDYEINDVDLQTYNMDLKNARSPSNAKVIMPAHCFGNACPEDQMPDDVTIIEDAACAAGSDGIGYGDMQIFSFHGSKVMTTGIGGMLTTDNKKWAETILRLCRADRPHYTRIAYNYQISDINSAMGIEQLKKLPHIVNKRREWAKRYDELLSKYCLPQVTKGSNYQSYVVRVENYLRDDLVAHLNKNDIEACVGTYSLSLLPTFSGDCPNGNQIFETQICLPLYTTLTEQDQDAIVDAFIKGYMGLKK